MQSSFAVHLQKEIYIILINFIISPIELFWLFLFLLDKNFKMHFCNWKLVWKQLNFCIFLKMDSSELFSGISYPWTTCMNTVDFHSNYPFCLYCDWMLNGQTLLYNRNPLTKDTANGGDSVYIFGLRLTINISSQSTSCFRSKERFDWLVVKVFHCRQLDFVYLVHIVLCYLENPSQEV